MKEKHGHILVEVITMILNDKQISKLAKGKNMIEPFIDHQVEENVLSWGLSSYGYDIRIGNQFKIFTDVSNVPVDPKNFDEKAFVHKEVNDPVLIPPNSFTLAVSVEKFNIPGNLLGILFDKSTYSRCGLLVSNGVAEPHWSGHLTLEISNTTPLPAKIYPNEGIAQMVFFQGDEPQVTYNSKTGKYQNQDNRPEPAKVV